MKSIALITALVLAPSVAFAAAAAPAPTPADIQNGQQLFKSNNCYQCHGDYGQGGQGPTIAPPLTPALGGFRAYVRHPAGEMPAFTAKVLTDADLAAIHAYLMSQPKPPADLPPLLKEPLGTK